MLSNAAAVHNPWMRVLDKFLTDVGGSHINIGEPETAYPLVNDPQLNMQKISHYKCDNGSSAGQNHA